MSWQHAATGVSGDDMAARGVDSGKCGDGKVRATLSRLMAMATATLHLRHRPRRTLAQAPPAPELLDRLSIWCGGASSDMCASAAALWHAVQELGQFSRCFVTASGSRAGQACVCLSTFAACTSRVAHARRTTAGGLRCWSGVQYRAAGVTCVCWRGARGHRMHQGAGLRIQAAAERLPQSESCASAKAHFASQQSALQGAEIASAHSLAHLMERGTSLSVLQLRSYVLAALTLLLRCECLASETRCVADA
jgi:hypothetical protein